MKNYSSKSGLYFFVTALLACAGASAQTLPQLLTSALQSHPSVQSRQALAQAAKSATESAKWAMYPTPSLSLESVGASASDSAYSADNRVVYMRLQQPLWTAGRLTAGLDRGQAGELYSQASTQEARQQLSLRVINAYAEWLTSVAKADTIEKNLGNYQALREQISRRIQEGVSATNELTLVDGRVQGSKAELALTLAQRDVSVSRLGQLTGAPVLAVQLSRERPEVVGLPGDLASLQEQALETDPNLRLAQASYQSADAALREKRADLLPEVYLRLERQYGNFTTPGQPAQSRIFIGMTSRFGAGLSVFSEEQRAVAQAESTREDIQTQRRAVLEQVGVERVFLESFTARIAASRLGVAAAAELVDSYGRQYLAGRKTWVEVMNAQRELLQVRLQHIDIELARWVTTWRLALMTQGASRLAG